MVARKPPPLPPMVGKNFYPPQPSRAAEQNQTPNWKPRGGETVYKTAVFLGSMIVVAMLLLVLICMARWDSIVRLVPVFNSDPRRWMRRRNRAAGSANSNSQQQFRRPDVEALSEDQQQYTLSNSLSKKNRSSNRRAVEALPVLNYSSIPGSSCCLQLSLVGTECTICLCDFADGDRVRILPDCYHGFHVECVDVWLIAHASCPSCRSNLHASSKSQQQLLPVSSSSVSSESSFM